MKELRPCFYQLQRNETPWGRHWGVTDYAYVEECGHEQCHRLSALIGEQRNLAESHHTHITCNCEKEFKGLHAEIEEARIAIKPESVWQEDKKIIETDKEQTYQVKIDRVKST